MGEHRAVETKELSGAPGGFGTLLKAALPSIPVVGQLPGVKKSSAAGFTGLAFSRATSIDRERVFTDSNEQNRPNLVDAPWCRL